MTHHTTPVSKGLWKEGEKERGSRQFGHMEDILDDDLEAQEAFSQEIHTQAAGTYCLHNPHLHVTYPTTYPPLSPFHTPTHPSIHPVPHALRLVNSGIYLL